MRKMSAEPQAGQEQPAGITEARMKEVMDEVLTEIVQITVTAGFTMDDGIEMWGRILMSLLLALNDGDKELAARDAETLMLRIAAALRIFPDEPVA